MFFDQAVAKSTDRFIKQPDFDLTVVDQRFVLSI
jgi:hypothetical protein